MKSYQQEKIDLQKQIRPYLEMGLENLEHERWTGCLGLENYKVSNLGRIKSLERTMITSNGQKRKVPKKIIKQQYKVSHGRPIDLSFSVNRKTYRVSNMVYNSFVLFSEIGKNEILMRVNKTTWDNSLRNLKVVPRSVSRQRDLKMCIISYLGAQKSAKAANLANEVKANLPTKICSICGVKKDRKHFGKGSRQCYPCLYLRDKKTLG
jgi:hypothetical protein